MALLFQVPDAKKIRVIIDTDAACEADDPFAITHALLSPKFIIKGIVAEHFVEEGSVEKSYREILTVLDATSMDVPAYLGQTGPSDENISEGVRFIIDEAMRDDPKPLVLLCLGAITNVAVAMRVCPEIKSRIRIIWNAAHDLAPCTAPYREFNAGNDIAATNAVLQSGADVWLIPLNAYSTMCIGLSEIQRRIYPIGRIGKHLFENMIAYNASPRADWTMGESWSLCDNDVIGVALNTESGKFVYTHAPVILEDTSSALSEDTPLIHICTAVNSRYIIEDFIAKLELNADVLPQ